MLFRWRLILTLTCSFLILSACRSGDERNKPPPGPLPVSLQLQWVIQTQFAGYLVALHKGWFLEEGIALTIHTGGPDYVPVDLVADGNRDFGTTLVPDLAVAVSRGKQVVAIAQIQQSNGLILLSRKIDNIRQPADFIGKKVGVWLGSWEQQFDALLATAHIDPANIQIVSQGWSMKPFLSGELDVASAMIYNEYQTVLEAGIPARDLHIIDYASYDADFPGDVLFTSRRMASENPDLCRRMVQTCLRGWQYAISNPDEAVRIVLKYDKSGVQNYNHQFTMLREYSRLMQTTDGRLGYPNDDKLSSMMHQLNSTKVTSRPLAAKEIYSTEFLP